MLMRAVRLAESGEVVTLLDRAASSGGAWGARELLGCENVEFGAHLLENRDALYATLVDGLGLDLEVDPCISIIRGRRLSMGWTRAAFQIAVGTRALGRGEIDKFKRSWRAAARTALSDTRSYCYPRLGAAAMVQALCRRLRTAGGRIYFGVDVASIAVDSGGVQLATSRGEITASRAIVSSRAFAPISIDGTSQALGVEKGVCRNVVMRLSGGGGKPFSYVEILGDSCLKRIRDLSALVRPKLTPPERIVCLQHRRAMTGDVMADAHTLIRDLVRVGLFDAPPDLIGAVRTDVGLSTLTDAALSRLERRSGGRLETLRTTDLADGFIDWERRLALSPGQG